jgi:hypothetical protein
LTSRYNGAIKTDGHRIAGTLANMKIASLLILWSSTLLHAEGVDRSLVLNQGSRSGQHVGSAVIQTPVAGYSLDGLGGVNASASLWDEEDNLDDDLFDTALHLPSWLDLRGRNRLDCRAYLRDRVPESPTPLIPLRC